MAGRSTTTRRCRRTPRPCAGGTSSSSARADGHTVTAERQSLPMAAMSFFRTESAPTLIEDGIMSMPEIAPDVYTTYDLSGLLAGEETTVLFKGEGPEGFSLVK